MLRVIYLSFVLLVGLTNPINFIVFKKRLDLYTKNYVYLNVNDKG